MTTVVVTGASGFIGGQTALQLHDLGHKVIGIDTRECPEHLTSVFGDFITNDFASNQALKVIYDSDAVAIVHCAGTSLVRPSMKNPAVYYDNNVVKTKRMLDSLVQGNKLDIRVIFSSSAAVYGEPVMTPCHEEDPPMPLSPYGESKLMVEMMLQSYFRAYGLQPVIFRYFNVCGADSKQRHGQESSASHIITRVINCLLTDTPFRLNGTTYDTPDGTCVRDYVHVEDIARAHVMAINSDVPTGVYNLGSSAGVSNLEIINTTQEVVGKKLKLETSSARPGDPVVLTASSERFNKVVGEWRQFSLKDIIQHAWAWNNR